MNKTTFFDREVNTCRGFTLLEILVTIVISAVLALILVQVMSSQSNRSYRPVQTYTDRLALESAMENITADYRQLRSGGSPLIVLQDRLEPEAGLTTYWDGSSGISVTSYCLDLNDDASAEPGENNIRETCTLSDIILKVTLSKGDLSLTTLFTRE